jgi:undecaprenyl-diphosphatase
MLALFGLLAHAVGEGKTQRFDDSIRNAIHQAAASRITIAMRRITSLGAPLVLVPGSVVAAVLFALRARMREAVLFVVAMVGGELLESLLKLVFRRARPTPFFDLPPPSSYSFPSGHALVSVCFYGALAALVAPRLRSRSARIAVWTSAAIVILAVGLSRIYLGVHHASDVLAGYAAACVWVIAVGWADLILLGRRRTL